MKIGMIFAAIGLFVSTLLLTIVPASANPSFDCAKASTKVENLICARPGLAQLDSDLADAYATALRDVSWSSANKRIRADQHAWIARRNRCDTAKCLRRLYHQRIGALYAELDDSDDASFSNL